MVMSRCYASITVALLAIFGLNRAVFACPFCSAVSQTLRQEMGVMDAIAIAEATPESIRDELTGQVSLKIITVLKGESLVMPGSTIRAVYYGEVTAGRRFMVSGADPKDMQWACLPIAEVSEKYLLDVAKLPDDPLERLKFYQKYLQHPDGMLNRDAYDEFAITPYPVVQALKPFMNHGELISWLREPELPADRKRLYLTMLGVCGSEKDVPMLEDMLKSTAGSTRGGLDALIACYLVLAGEKGLPMIDEMFLKNAKAPYADTYAAIMAIRFHGTETDIIPRSSLVNSLHYVLDRKDLADLVIPDLARWGDWTQIDKLVQLFVDAEKDNNWIRVPVVNYLRACPKPEAAAAIEKLKEIDPDSVRRAGSVFSIPVPAPAKPPATSMLPKSSPYASRKIARGSIGEVLADSSVAVVPFATNTEHAFVIAQGLDSSIAATPVLSNRLAVATVPLVVFLGLIGFMYLVLRGSPLRIASSN
jgi:hypothetical protein